MLSDGFPPGVMAWTTNQSDVSGVVAELTAAGDGNVHYLALTPQAAPFGEDYHPTRATHQQMAEAVANELRRLLPASQ
jgi:phospholipase/lecithinase/hemolysin